MAPKRPIQSTLSATAIGYTQATGGEETNLKLKIALLAFTAAAALFGAAIIGVPSSSDRASTPLVSAIPR